jgi:hypothetical protein
METDSILRIVEVVLMGGFDSKRIKGAHVRGLIIQLEMI